MANIPKRYKYSCIHRLSYEGKAKGNRTVAFGSFGLKAETGSYITERQIEATRIAITRYMKRGGKVWIRIFPHMPVTKKPAEVRMGSGKGAIDHWVAVVKKETIMFEAYHTDPVVAKEALRLGMHKLPIKCKIVANVKNANDNVQNQSELQQNPANVIDITTAAEVK